MTNRCGKYYELTKQTKQGAKQISTTTADRLQPTKQKNRPDKFDEVLVLLASNRIVVEGQGHAHRVVVRREGQQKFAEL